MKYQHSRVLGHLAACLALLAGMLAMAGLPTRQVAAASPKTLVDKNILVSTSWVRANSPYLVTVPISVGAAATLTIQPGVEVQFLKGAGLRIDGGLQAIGTHIQPIVMRAGGDDWLGLQVVQPAADVRLESVTVQDALSGLTIGPAGAAANHRVDVVTSLIQGNTVGIDVDGALLSSLRLVIRNTLITDNQLGLHINGLPASPRFKVEHNSFVGNGIGLKAENIGGQALKVPLQWWGSASGPQLLPGDDLTCMNSVPPAPGTQAQDIICGQEGVDAALFTKVPAGRVLVPFGNEAKLEMGIGSIALSDTNIAATSLLTVSIPFGTFAQPVDLVAAPHIPDGAVPGQPTLLDFEISAAAGGQALHLFDSSDVITVEVKYDPTDLNGANPAKLVLYYFDERTGLWNFAGISSKPDALRHRLVARLDHLTRFRVIATDLFTYYLPMAQN